MTWKNDQVSESETTRILDIAKEHLSTPGDFVEFGCYRGDTSILLQSLLVENHVDKSVKKLWIYDSFEGLPDKTSQDQSALGANFKKGELEVTKAEVKKRFLRSGLPVPIIKKAWFSDLTDKDLPDQIAFAFLDGDFYESIRDSLRLIAPRMHPDGVAIIHDYTNPALPGVQKAVDEFRSGRIIKFQLILL